MTRRNNSIIVLGNRSARRTRRPRRDPRPPDPAPVVIVRAASVATTPRTPTQRARRADAQQLAAALTDAARHGVLPWYDPGCGCAVSEIPRAAAIVREAPAMAAAGPAGALQVGRDRHGRAVAVAVHAERWSLVIRPTTRPHQPAVSWAFIDGYGHDTGPGHICFRFDNDGSVAGIAWSDMLSTVLAATT